MTKEEFAELQSRHQESGKSLKEFLREVGLGYSTYNYRRKKYLAAEEPHGLAPISFRQRSSLPQMLCLSAKDLPAGATLLFTNGLRAHFCTDTEGMLMELLDKSLVSHVML